MTFLIGYLDLTMRTVANESEDSQLLFSDQNAAGAKREVEARDAVQQTAATDRGAVGTPRPTFPAKGIECLWVLII